MSDVFKKIKIKRVTLGKINGTVLVFILGSLPSITLGIVGLIKIMFNFSTYGIGDLSHICLAYIFIASVNIFMVSCLVSYLLYIGLLENPEDRRGY